jgi:hypothetical protein
MLAELYHYARCNGPTGKVLTRLRWSDFPLQSEMGIAPITLKACPIHVSSGFDYLRTDQMFARLPLLSTPR